MSDVAVVPIVVDSSRPREGEIVDVGAHRRRLGVLGWLCLGWLGLLVLAAVSAPLLPLPDPKIVDFSVPVAASPSLQNPLGTDELGRDILSRLIWGARVSLVVAVGVVTIGGTVGTAIGVVAGYYRGKTEGLLMAVVDILLAFPALILLIAITAFLGAGLRNVTLSISLLAVPAFARIARANTLTFATRDFVTAARALGATNRRIIWRELLPNIVYPIVAFALLVAGVAIVAEGGLAFLGLSVPNPEPSWGSMIDNGRGDLGRGIWHISLVPALTMFITVLAVNMLGDRFRVMFDTNEAVI